MICPKCKREYVDDTQFCDDCGCRLIDLPTAQPIPAVAPAPAEDPEETYKQALLNAFVDGRIPMQKRMELVKLQRSLNIDFAKAAELEKMVKNQIDAPERRETLDHFSFPGVKSASQTSSEGIQNKHRTIEDAKSDMQNGFEFNEDFSFLKSVPTDIEGEYIVPDCVKGIDIFAFVRKPKLSSVIIPDTVRTIGLFALCPLLRTIRLPQNLVEIPSCAFLGCMALGDISIPAGVESIGNHAFSYCINLKKLDLGTQINSIGEYAFSYSALTKESVSNLSTVSELADNAFNNSGRTPYAGKFQVVLHGANNIHGFGYYKVDAATYELITNYYSDENLPARFVSGYYDQDEAAESFPELSESDFNCIEYFMGPAIDEFTISVYDENGNSIWGLNYCYDNEWKIFEGLFEPESRMPTLMDKMDETSDAIFCVEELLDGHHTLKLNAEGMFDPSKLTKILLKWNHEADGFVNGFCYSGQETDTDFDGFSDWGWDCDPESYCVREPDEDSEDYDDEEIEEFEDEDNEDDERIENSEGSEELEEVEDNKDSDEEEETLDDLWDTASKDLAPVMTVFRTIHDSHIFIAPELDSKKIDKAMSTYAPGVELAEVLVHVDDTLFGGAKEGLIVTRKCLYSKELADSPRKVKITSETTFELQNKTLLVDGSKVFSFSMPEVPEMEKLVRGLQMLAELA